MYCNKIDHTNHDNTVHWIDTLTLYEQHYEKTCFCILENKGADQLSGYRTADQRFCFYYVDSTSPLKFQASSHLLLLYSQICVGNPEDKFSHEAARL